MMNLGWLYALSVVLVAFTLPIFSYLTLIYRELGRMTTGRFHQHLEIFEAEIEPKLKINRRSGGRTFRILGHFWLAFLCWRRREGWCTSFPAPGNLSSSSSCFLCWKSSLRCTLSRTCCCAVPPGAGCCLFCRWFAG